MLFFKNVIPAPATRLRGHKLRMCKLIPAQADEGIQSSPSFPCFHRGRLCGSRDPEISKCDFICICLYWFPAYAGMTKRNVDDSLIVWITA